LCDWLDDQVAVEWLADLLDLIQATSSLDWQLLTKRPDNWEKRLNACNTSPRSPALAEQWLGGDYPRNVWLGVTAEDQFQFDRRVMSLHEIPAALHFISIEPMLEVVSIHQYRPGWVICGGESGPDRRWFHSHWAENLFDQCRAWEIPFFMKQDGAARPGEQGNIPGWLWAIKQFPNRFERKETR
jgi:protein gp37